MIGVVFKIKCRAPYVWVNFSALTKFLQAHIRKKLRTDVTSRTIPRTHNPLFQILLFACCSKPLKSHLRATRRNFQAKLQAEISHGIEIFLTENQPNYKQHTWLWKQAFKFKITTCFHTTFGYFGAFRARAGPNISQHLLQMKIFIYRARFGNKNIKNKKLTHLHVIWWYFSQPWFLPKFHL